ncbi:MAG: hypothetical protein E6K76_10795 [Candidatus Eisenbacteria bacterium]|uniref:Uncharacterized protein n=1 Tax=Eiseniibacteriota bacterium TaxID=2212470 RepID=A0A538T117_UNCEI|nr:MAG: hypothetical protein E6K76_10795 [Candidatus Eisenbacteria bacterium]
MKRGAALLVLTLTALGAIYEWGGPARKGVRALRAHRLDEALDALRAGRSEMPSSAVIPYDEALAHLGRGEADSAQIRFGEAMTLRGDPARAAAAYNMGNQSMRAMRFAEAARYYREALRITPRDLDAKRNLEEAIRRLRQPLGQPRREPQAGGAGPPTPGGRENPVPQPMGGGAKEPRQTPRGSSGEFTREEAEQWLQALESERRARMHEDQGRRQEETGHRDW